MNNNNPLLVLTYHAIDDRSAVISVSPEKFRWQMRQLTALGMKGISLAQAFAHLEQTGCYPPDAAVLTFDDGYLSVLEHALPVMAEHDFSATVFLVTSMMGMNAVQARAAHPDFDRGLLDWDQAETLVRAGLEVGSHTVSHPDLRCVSPCALEQELEQSKTLLEQRLQLRVDALAYPYGHFNAEVLATTSRYYRRACTTRLGRCGRQSDPWQLNRVDTYYLQRPQRFLKLLEGRLEGWLQFRQHLRDLKNLAGRAAPKGPTTKATEARKPERKIDHL